MKIIKAVQFVAMAAAVYCAVATAALTIIPGLYPTKEMTDRVQFLVFELAAFAFLAMLVCWFAARTIRR